MGNAMNPRAKGKLPYIWYDLKLGYDVDTQEKWLIRKDYWEGAPLHTNHNQAEIARDLSYRGL